MTTNSASSPTPTAIGISPSGDPQPWIPAVTIPYTSTIWPPVSVIAPARSKLASPCSRRRFFTIRYATAAAASAIGGLMSRIHRQLNASVRIPPSRTPAAPPTPFIAPHSAIALYRAGPAANDEVMIASEVAAISAPANPCAPRATISVV